MKLNCLIIDNEPASGKFIEFYVRHSGDLNLVNSCEDLTQAEMINERNQIDLMFLNVDLPGHNGLEVLSGNKMKSMVILVTAQDNLAVQAFEYDVVDYLLKPFSYPRFQKAVERAKKQYGMNGRKSSDCTLLIKSAAFWFRVHFADIIYIAAEGDYMQIVTREKKYHTYGTMNEMFNRLPENHFSRVHRSYIVNNSYVSQVNENHLVVGSISIPIGVSYRKQILSTAQVS